MIDRPSAGPTAALHSDEVSGFLDELLSVLLGAVPTVEVATILLREGDELRVEASIGRDDPGGERYVVPLDRESYAGAIALDRRPLEVADASRSPLIQSAWLRAHGALRLYGLPLLRDGEVLGVAYVGWRGADDLTARDERRFHAMVERAAWAVAENAKRARLYDVLSSAPALIAILRAPADVLEVVNDACAAFFGRTDLVGQPLAALGLDTTFGAIAAEARRTGATAAIDEVQLPDGRVLRVSAQPLPVLAGSVDRVVVFGVDLTAQVAARAERQRVLELERRARRDAELASRMKDEFLATISHELRTPLNAILGWTVIARSKATPELDRALAVVERNAHAQTRMIEEVLDVSRVVTGKLRLDPSDVDVGAIVADALEAVRPAAQAKGITLTVSIAEDVALRADAHRLQQVVWNLLSNAIKFTPRGGHVELAASETPEAVTVRVTDSGEGIDEAFLPHIFELFRQADASMTRRHGGLGLGLALVKQFVVAHGGTIRATSEGLGRGASFVLELPKAARIEASPARPATLPEPPSRPGPSERAPIRLEGLKVLVVDDDEDARALLAEALALRGAVIAEATSARRALDALDRFRPDVLVSDIAMPGEDGFALIRAVRALPAARGGKTPAIAVTAHARAVDGARAFAAGFQAHLAKPVDLGHLVSFVANLGGLSFV